MKFWSRGSNFSLSQRGIRVIRVQASQAKMTAKWGEIQEKWDLVWVSGKFKLSGSTVVVVWICHWLLVLWPFWTAVEKISVPPRHMQGGLDDITDSMSFKLLLLFDH